MAFTTKEVAQIFGFAEPTVRKWAVEFGQYLSPTAHPGNGKKRSFANRSRSEKTVCDTNGTVVESLARNNSIDTGADL